MYGGTFFADAGVTRGTAPELFRNWPGAPPGGGGLGHGAAAKKGGCGGAGGGGDPQGGYGLGDIGNTLGWLSGTSPAAGDVQHTLEWLSSGPPPPVTLQGEAAAADGAAAGAAAASSTPPAPAPPPPPVWSGSSVCGGRVVRVGAEPTSVLDAVGSLFEEQVVPNEVVPAEAWALRGSAFVDFVALGVEVRVYADPAATPATVAVFRHTTANDIVRFGAMVSLVVEALRSRGLAAHGPPAGTASAVAPWRSTLGDDFDDDDFAFDDDCLEDDNGFEEGPWSSWSRRVGSMLEALGGSKTAAAREEIWQTLASWARSSPGCRQDLARGILEWGTVGLILRTLEAGPAALAEQYPMAVALKLVSPHRPLSAEGALGVSQALQGLRRAKGAASLPALVRRELDEAIGLLCSETVHVDAKWLQDTDRITEATRCTFDMDSYRPTNVSEYSSMWPRDTDQDTEVGHQVAADTYSFRPTDAILHPDLDDYAPPLQAADSPPLGHTPR